MNERVNQFSCICQTCFGSRGSMQTLRNVWTHLGVVNVMAFMNYELTVKHTYTFADLLQLLQHMACRNLIYRASRKINLRKLHLVGVNSYWLSPRSQSPTELWQLWWQSGSATFKPCFIFELLKRLERTGLITLIRAQHCHTCSVRSVCAACWYKASAMCRIATNSSGRIH